MKKESKRENDKSSEGNSGKYQRFIKMDGTTNEHKHYQLMTLTFAGLIVTTCILSVFYSMLNTIVSHLPLLLSSRPICKRLSSTGWIIKMKKTCLPTGSEGRERVSTY